MSTWAVYEHIRFLKFLPPFILFVVLADSFFILLIASCWKLIKTPDSCRATSITDPCWSGTKPLGKSAGCGGGEVGQRVTRFNKKYLRAERQRQRKTTLDFFFFYLCLCVVIQCAACQESSSVCYHCTEGCVKSTSDDARHRQPINGTQRAWLLLYVSLNKGLLFYKPLHDKIILESSVTHSYQSSQWTTSQLQTTPTSVKITDIQSVFSDAIFQHFLICFHMLSWLINKNADSQIGNSRKRWEK